MCENHKPWLEVSDLVGSAECLYFGDQDGICRQPDSSAYLERCPSLGRAPWEESERPTERFPLNSPEKRG